MIRFVLLWGAISFLLELCGLTELGWWTATFPFWGPPTFLFILFLLAVIGFGALLLLIAAVTTLFPK